MIKFRREKCERREQNVFSYHFLALDRVCSGVVVENSHCSNTLDGSLTELIATTQVVPLMNKI